MRAGTLRVTLDVQERRDGTATNGASDPCWVSLAPSARRASIRPLSARELEAAGQIQSRRTHEVRMRWFEALRPAGASRYRLVRQARGSTRIFNVESVIDVDERHAEALFVCVESAEAA